MIELGRGLDEALGRDGRKEIMINVKGRRGNAPIYRAQNWVNEATSAIQKKTYGGPFEKRN